jgi:beta-N-acetylhexosaminidase
MKKKMIRIMIKRQCIFWVWLIMAHTLTAFADMTHEIKPVIFGVSGLELTAEESSFFAETQPLGFILFARNCNNPEQIVNLVTQLKSTVHHQNVPILIDQEGGRVSRLPEQHYKKWPAAQSFADKFLVEPESARRELDQNYTDIARTLFNLGISVNCAPCMDVLHPQTHPVIGDRAFCPSPQATLRKSVSIVDNTLISVELSCIAIQSHYLSGVVPFMKHIPGHGSAMIDSHFALPITGKSIEELKSDDFFVFKQACELLTREGIAHPFGMTAHIVFSKIDEVNPATCSSTVINDYIRGYIGFKGFLVSDCITMNALKGELIDRATSALLAGCDAILHCSGELHEMQSIARYLPPLTEEAYSRFSIPWDYAQAIKRECDAYQESILRASEPQVPTDADHDKESFYSQEVSTDLTSCDTPDLPFPMD